MDAKNVTHNKLYNGVWCYAEKEQKETSDTDNTGLKKVNKSESRFDHLFWGKMRLDVLNKCKTDWRENEHVLDFCRHCPRI